MDRSAFDSRRSPAAEPGPERATSCAEPVPRGACIGRSRRRQASARAISVGPGTQVLAPRNFRRFRATSFHAVNADTGALVGLSEPTRIRWFALPDPALADGRLLPLSSLEEGSGANPAASAARSRGGVVAYDAKTGAEVWRCMRCPLRQSASRRMRRARQLWGPAGAAIWAARPLIPSAGCSMSRLEMATTIRRLETSDAVVALRPEDGTSALVEASHTERPHTSSVAVRTQRRARTARTMTVQISTSATHQSSARCRTDAASSRSVRSRRGVGTRPRQGRRCRVAEAPRTRAVRLAGWSGLGR